MIAAPVRSTRRALVCCCSAVFVIGCADPMIASDGARHASEVIAAPGAHAGPFGDPELAVNGVRGAGDDLGSFDVFALDFEAGASLTLGFGGARFLDGPGADLAVFENGFRYRGTDTYFMDLAIVAVSPDGQQWVELPHDYVAPDETRYSSRREDWIGFAGRTPVRLHEDTNRVDPFDTEAAGGDAFDLASLDPTDPIAARVLADGVIAVRLIAAPSRANPDTGAPYVADPTSYGADIDGVYARWFAP